MRGVAGDRLAAAPSHATVRERRVALVRELAARYVYDLGLMLAGRPDGFDAYVAPLILAELRGAVEVFLAGAARFHPDFGASAQLTIEGDPGDVGAPVTCHVDFESRSSLLQPDTTLVTMPRRRLRVTLLLDADLHTVVSQRVDAR